MSQSPASIEASESREAMDAYSDAVVQLNEMILAGKSLSGRERHCAYLNTGGGRFANISGTSGFDFADDGRGMGAVDWDFDGDLDFWVTNRTGPRLRFLRNEVSTPNRFLAVRLRGNGTSSNRDAIGARLELRVGDVTLLRTLKAGEGYLSQSSKWVHFGLGEVGEVGPLVVRWPDGTRVEYDGLAANGFYDISQRAAEPEIWTPPARTVPFASSDVEPRRSTQTMRLVLPTRTPLPPITYTDLDGNERALSEHLDEPLLVNLWASWCAPCRKELADLAAAGVHVLALSVDEWSGGSPTGPADARALLAKIGAEFPAGFADEHATQVLQSYHDAHFINRRPLPLPTSFLVDTDGMVAAIYKGAVTAGQVRNDIAHLGDDPAELRDRSTPFKGRWFSAPPTMSAVAFADRFTDDGLLVEAEGILDAAEVSAPGRALAYFKLADRLAKAGEAARADAVNEKARAAQRH